MTLGEIRLELERARDRAMQDARRKDASLADAFVYKGKIEGLDYALSLLESVDEQLRERRRKMTVEEMSGEERQRAFGWICYLFSCGQPALPSDFRKFGIERLGDARELMRAFNESEMRQGSRWLIEERPHECQVIDPETGETRPGTVTGFFGKLDYAYRSLR